MPIFGYSERDLDEAHERGRRDGRTRCIRELFNALSEIFPDLVHITDRDSYFDIPNIIRGVRSIQERELSRYNHQQSKIEFLKYVRSRLENEIDALETGKLHTEIEELTAERDRLRQQAAATQSDLEQLRATHRSERQELLDEIEQLDELVIEYENKTQNAR